MKAHDFKSAKSLAIRRTIIWRICIELHYKVRLLIIHPFEKESERAKMQGKAEMQQWVFSLIVLLCFIVVIFILYIYKSYKHQIKLRMEHEREVLLQKQQMQEKYTKRNFRIKRFNYL